MCGVVCGVVCNQTDEYKLRNGNQIKLVLFSFSFAAAIRYSIIRWLIHQMVRYLIRGMVNVCMCVCVCKNSLLYNIQLDAYGL